MLNKDYVFKVISLKEWIPLLINNVEIHLSDKYKEDFYDDVILNNNISKFLLKVLRSEDIWFTVAGTQNGRDLYMKSRGDDLGVLEEPSCFLPETFFEEKPLYNSVANDYVLNSFKFLESRLQNVRKKYYEAEELYDYLFRDKEFFKDREFVFNGACFELKKIEKPADSKEDTGGIHVVGVRFLNQSSGYYNYFGDNKIYNLGDEVLVPTGNNGEQVGRVVFRKIYKSSEPLPFGGRLKSVIRKL